MASRSPPTRLKHDELVAPKASNEMASRCLAKPLGSFDEQGIPGGVAEGIVDPLEVVEVEAVQREQAVLAFRGAEQLLQLLVEHRSVRQAGKDVVEGELSDPLLALDDLTNHLIEARREARKLVAAANTDLDTLAAGKPPRGFVEPR